MAQDRYKYFRIEGREILEGLTKGLLELETRADPEVVSRLLRLAHTLKGAARIVGHRELADLAHEMEDVLGPLRGSTTPQRLDGALALLDRMSALLAGLSPPGPQRTASPGAAEPPSPAPPSAPIPRADPTALDDVLGGLAEVHRLVTRLRGGGDLAAIDQGLDQLERELRAVRQDAERLRLLEAGTSFTALERTLRDAALAAGKRIAFASSGGDVRIDAHVLATLHGALVQLVRNAVAHGIERPDERITAGKAPEGRVAIAFALRGSRIAVTCEDDGRGIDHEAVRRAAIRAGLAAERARALDRDQLIDLLLRGGLTTSAEVTVLAGRGIGLDVVREAAHVLRGEVAARTTVSGTAITIVAPISIAGVSVLVLGAGDRVAAIPLAAVRRVARASALAVLRSGDGLAVALDDVMVPFAPLARLLGATDGGGGAHGSIVIVDGGGGLAALGADRVLGVDEAVVRSLPPGAPIDRIVRGVALDAEGLPRAIFEPAELVIAVRGMPAATPEPVKPPQPILIVDDSLTTRMLEQSILESAGYKVDLAISAEDALVKVTHRSYGLFLVDVEMPGMDGFGFISALRGQPELAATPAILVTSRNRPEDLQRGVAVGAQGYVVKGDFDQTRLLEMIDRLVLR